MFEERKSHPYLVYDEMKRTPEILNECFSKDNLDVLREMANEIVDKEIGKVYFIGAGTSFIMGVASTYAFNSISKMPTQAIESFEFAKYPPFDIGKKTLVFTVSHSGRTKITVDAASLAKDKGAYVFAMTDGEDSPLTKIAEIVSLGPGGLERSFPNTRSYVSALLRSYLLSVMVAEAKSDKVSRGYLRKLEEVPALTRRIFDSAEKLMIDLAEELRELSNIYVLGGGPNYATACESALKFMEASLLKACPFEMEEFAHGPFVLSDKETLVIAIAPPGESYDRVCDHIEGQRHLPSTTLSLVRKGDAKISKLSDKVVEISDNLDEVFTPIPYIMPLYLLAYYLAVKRRINPDIFRMNEKDYLNAYNVIYSKQRPDIEIYKYYKR